jgi:hypothetical protein
VSEIDQSDKPQEVPPIQTDQETPSEGKLYKNHFGRHRLAWLIETRLLKGRIGEKK